MINITESDRQRLVRFLLDFNAVRERNRLSALGRYASAGWEQLKAGDWVLTYDGEGNECLSYVEGRRGDDVFDLLADWDTWVPGDQARVRILSPVPSGTATRVPAGIR